MPIGRNLLTPQYQGVPSGVSADGRPEWKSIGATIDWAAVAAAGASAGLAPGAAPTPSTATTGGFIPPGVYYVQHTYLSVYGESLASAEATITVPAGTSTNTVTITSAANTPTGTVGIRGYISTQSGLEEFAGQAVQAAGASGAITLKSLPKTGAGAPPVIDMSGSADGSLLYPDGTVVAAGAKALRYGQVLCLGVNSLYGPYDPAAADTTRRTLVPGQCGIVNLSRLYTSPAGFTTGDVDHVGLIVGGKVYINNILHSGAATHTLAAGPTLAELLAAFPRLLPVYNA